MNHRYVRIWHFRAQAVEYCQPLGAPCPCSVLKAFFPEQQATRDGTPNEDPSLTPPVRRDGRLTMIDEQKVHGYRSVNQNGFARVGFVEPSQPFDSESRSVKTWFLHLARNHLFSAGGEGFFPHRGFSQYCLSQFCKPSLSKVHSSSVFKAFRPILPTFQLHMIRVWMHILT